MTNQEILNLKTVISQMPINQVMELKKFMLHNGPLSVRTQLTPEEKCSRLEAQVNLLKAENELLKKIRFAERRQQKK